jgi:pimeloyl-ACP methyl ester carboxylesterase
MGPERLLVLARTRKSSYALQRYTSMPRGGHFAAFEEPELLADEIAAFFATIE